MKRKIIRIKEELCNGCGDCITGCDEGALKIIDGKARLVKEDFCDGFGDCIGHCPTGALTIEEREATPFDERAVKENLLNTMGPEAVKKMENTMLKHELKNQSEPMNHTQEHSGGCPGSRMVFREATQKAAPTTTGTGQAFPSELKQWPVQLHLVNPQAPYFQNQELVVLSTCSPIASADIHWRFMRGRAVVVACPKLDNLDGYVEKLAAIFTTANTPKVISVIMEVPCCSGLSQIVQQAKAMSKREDLIFEKQVINIDGEIQQGMTV